MHPMPIWGRSVKAFSLCCLFVCCFCEVTAQAADRSPEDTVKAILGAAKEQGSIVALLPFIHWKSALNEAKQSDSIPAELNSPEEMRNYFTRMLIEPKELFLEKHSTPPESLPPARHDAYLLHVKQSANELEQQIEAANRKLKQVQYRVVGSRLSGDRAEVDVVVTLRQKETTRTWTLIQVDGQWLLPSIQAAGALL